MAYKYIFIYKNEEQLYYNSAVEAVKDFNERGYGMSNWVITRNGVEISLEEFNEDVDKERA
jgi:hypothetical protein